MPSALKGLASPTQATPAAAVADPPALPAQVLPNLSLLPSELSLFDLLAILSANGLAATGVGLASGAWAAAAQATDQIVGLENQILTRERHLHHEHHEILGLLGHPRPSGLGAGLGQVSGGMGRAVSVAGLSVPSGWAVAAPEIRAVAFALPATSVGAAPAVWAGMGTAFSQMALAGMAGSALAGTVSSGRQERVGATTQRARSPQRPPASPVTKSPQPPAATPVTGIAADHLRELALAVLHDARILTDEEFTEKRRLLGL
jgi:PPE-repeat protein